VGDVVEFRRKAAPVEPEPEEQVDPHMSGRARCVGCGHGWEAVAPIGTTRLECPGCGTQRGAFVCTTEPAEGLRWKCKCGNDLFSLHDKGAPCCARCGLRATGWVET